MREKFAAKFAEAGNLKLQDVSQFPTSSLARSGLDIDRFPQHFSAGFESRGSHESPGISEFGNCF